MDDPPFGFGLFVDRAHEAVVAGKPNAAALG
jgi:hypothetical protein